VLHIVGSNIRSATTQRMHCSASMARFAIFITLLYFSSNGKHFRISTTKMLTQTHHNFPYKYIVFFVIKCEGRPILIYFRDGNGRSSNGFCRECQSIQSSQLLATKILSKAFREFAELATKENAHSLINNFVTHIFPSQLSPQT
jgi:hypothetical protein